MYLNAFRIRLALMGAGILTLLVYVAMGGRLGPSNDGVVQVEFGTYPEAFEGLQVAIDGQPAGELRRLGAATRTGFQVEEGSHELRLITSRFVSRPRQVNVSAGHTLLLVLEIGDSGSGLGKPEVYFQ
jgi:hypothetical protein